MKRTKPSAKALRVAGWSKLPSPVSMATICTVTVVIASSGLPDRFAAVEAAYRQAPEVTRQRMYLETMQQILPQVGRKVFVAQGTTGVLPLLSLDGGARAATAALTDTTQRTGGGQ